MTTEKAILAGGCFWGMQDLIRKLPGVVSTRVGYTGGDVANATYRNHKGRGNRDHLRPRQDLLPGPAGVLLPDPRPVDQEPPGQRHRHQLPVGHLLPQRRPEARRRGHDRRRRHLRPVARQGRHRGHPGRRVLGGRARAPGLPGALPQRLHLPLPPPRLEAPAPDRRRSSGPFSLTGASPRSWSLTRRAVAPHPPVGEASFHLTAVQVRDVLGSRSTRAPFDSTVGI